jgi:23S rRNA G2445 N2-methylase RlmL
VARVIARCVHGLEWVAADEIATRFPAAGSSAALARREVVFDLPRLDPALLDLRTVDDIFLLVGSVGEVGTAKDAVAPLARRLARLPWPERLAAARALRPVPDGAIRFDVVASLAGRRAYNRFAVENEVGAALAPVLGGTHEARTATGGPAGDPDLTVRVFVHDVVATAALRLGSRPLHRRAYKLDTGPGTLHPPAAAALARLAALAEVAGPDGTSAAWDPFCGDGTIPIETALTYPAARVVATDLDPDRVAAANRNAARAGIDLAASVADAGRALPGPVDAVLTNPPWNLAVDARGSLAGSMEPFWRRLPDLLTPTGRLCVVTDADLDVPGTLRRMGYRVALATLVRLAGRVSDVVLAAPPAAEPLHLPESLATWHHRAQTAGVFLHP